MRKLIFCLAALSILLSFGCDKEDPMPPAPQVMAFFDVSNDNPEAGEEVLFTNKSENATIFEWDFGDGNTSSERDPIHIFSETGRYTIQLAAGRTIAGAAEFLGLNESTVRTQTKRIFSKTGVGRQGELIILINQSVAQLGADQ